MSRIVVPIALGLLLGWAASHALQSGWRYGAQANRLTFDGNTMAKSARQSWKSGDFFAVHLRDDTFVAGQSLDLMMQNIVTVAFVDIRRRLVTELAQALSKTPPASSDCFAAFSTWRDPLDVGRWVLVGFSATPVLPQNKWPNEEFRGKKWIGARHYNTALAEDFLNAYYGLSEWAQPKDPNYYDRLLVSTAERPRKDLSSGA